MEKLSNFDYNREVRTNAHERYGSRMNYKEKYLKGEIPFEEIDEYSFQWGMSDDERTLAQYLGLNAEEEDAWVSVGEDALRELLDRQK